MGMGMGIHAWPANALTRLYVALLMVAASIVVITGPRGAKALHYTFNNEDHEFYVTELKVNVGPREKSCFYMEGIKDDPLSLEYEVIGGGNLDIDVECFAPDEKLLYQEWKKQDGQLYIANLEENGPYEVCFNNRMSVLEHKIVYFKWSMGPDIEDFLATADMKGLDPLYGEVEYVTLQLRAEFVGLSGKLQHARNEEYKHRNLAEHLNSRVQMWSIAITVGILLVSCFQVYFLRGFFKDMR